MRILPWQDDIMDRLTTQIPHASFFDEGVTEIDELPRFDNGMVKPYATVWFGGSVEAGLGYNSAVCGITESARRGLFNIMCMGQTGRMARQLGDEVRAALVGFRPDGEGELAEDGAPTIRNPLDTGTGVDARYAYVLAFEGIVNTVSA